MMIHSKISSPRRPSHRRKRLTNSGRTISHDEETILTDESVPVRYLNRYRQDKTRAGTGHVVKRKKSYPIAPDGLIPNSTFRRVLEKKVVKAAEIKAFQLRLDILKNLPVNYNPNLQCSDDEDEEWLTLDDPDYTPNSTSNKKSKGRKVASHQKEVLPDVLKRVQEEPWWKHAKEEKANLRTVILHLIEILKLNESDSFESACFYIAEIFRTYGVEPVLVNAILDILLDHLPKENKSSNLSTVRTIAQFMIERKDIIIRLLENALKYQAAEESSRQEVINAIKFITDVNDSDGIDYILQNMSTVYNAAEENFSLKMIIQELDHKKKPVISQTTDAEEEEGEESQAIHSLLKKISEERWFPRERSSITLDYVLDAILVKLPDTSKSMLKVLTTHLVQLHRVIGYSDEQFNRASNGLISLLTHTDADFRLSAATNLANLGKETKAIDIALLGYFVSDPRVLVRTECGESLKKLTGIMSDVVLKDCADAIPYLQTLPEENFTLEGYLLEKNRVPTPPPLLSLTPPIPERVEVQEEEAESDVEENSTLVEVEQNVVPKQTEEEEEEEKETEVTVPTPSVIEQPTFVNIAPPPSTRSQTDQVSIPPSAVSSTTSIQPTIRVEVHERQEITPSEVPTSHKEQAPIQQRKKIIPPSKPPPTDQVNHKRPSFIKNMWNLYTKPHDIPEQKEHPDPPMEQSAVDPVETIIEEHTRTAGFYRMASNRRVLVPHKVAMDNILGDQTHLIVNHPSSPSSAWPANSMNLSDYNQNQHRLNDIEFLQLLSSLVIRAIQVHRQYEKFTPGSFAASFKSVLNISPMQLNASLPSTTNANPSSRLPPIVQSKQFTRMQANVQAKAAKEGINVRKAQHIEGVLSSLFKINQEKTKSTMISSLTSHLSNSKQNDVTHAWLLVQLLKAQGLFSSESCLQKITHTYPKFIPLLHTKIPPNLVSVIWNDPMIKQISSIFNNQQEDVTAAPSLIKSSETKPAPTTMEDECAYNTLDYSALVNRNESKKKFLPPLRSSKITLPRHVLKFGFREIEMDSSETSNNSSREESRSRKRRIYMHLMMSPSDSMSDRHESVKSQLSHIDRTDYQTTLFLPIIGRPPICH